MADMADLLLEPAHLIAWSLRELPDYLLWRFSGYSDDDKMRVKSYENGGKTIAYCRASDPYATLILDNIRCVDVVDKQTRTDPLGSPVNIDGREMVIENYDGIIPIDQTYTCTFDATTGREDALTLGFEQSARAMLRIGNDNTPAAAELELTITASQEKAKTISSTRSKGREFSTNIVCPPGYDMKFVGTSSIQKQRITEDGRGRIEYNIAIGKHEHGRWANHPGAKGRKYPRHGEWASLEDFLGVLRGNGSRDQYFWEHFRNHPIGWIADRINGPLDVPFHQVEDFDGMVTDRVRPVVLRGPKFPEQAVAFDG